MIRIFVNAFELGAIGLMALSVFMLSVMTLALLEKNVPLKPLAGEHEATLASAKRSVSVLIVLVLAILLVGWLSREYGFILKAYSALTSLAASTLCFYLWWDAFGLKSRWVMLLAATCGLSTTASWLLFPTPLTLNLAATLNAVAALALLGSVLCRRIKPLLWIFGAVVVFDVLAVFASGTMINAANSILELNLPQMISTRHWSMGLGDIVLPGLGIVYGWRRWTETANPMLYVGGIAGWFVGFCLTVMLATMTSLAQPATLYLIPCVILGLWLGHLFDKEQTTLA